ncbi:MAG: hypothetical protein Q7R81_07345 [Candidatus Peregrinibacteria bacterium]|nr:hypothetical protein [Candidatus Peregrinibacteria bacterium]
MKQAHQMSTDEKFFTLDVPKKTRRLKNQLKVDPAFCLWNDKFVYIDEHYTPYRWDERDGEWVEMLLEPFMRVLRDASVVSKEEFFEEFRNRSHRKEEETGTAAVSGDRRTDRAVEQP